MTGLAVETEPEAAGFDADRRAETIGRFVELLKRSGRGSARQHPRREAR